MAQSPPTSRGFDLGSIEMIFAIAFLSLHDLLLSDALSLPLVLRNSTLAGVKALDKHVSNLEYMVPVVIYSVILFLWLARKNTWVYRLAVIFLGWVTLRLIIKVALVLLALVTDPQKHASGLLQDTVVLWFVIIVIFGVWYWIIDGGGPHMRRKGLSQRFDFAFPQHTAPFMGWENWHPQLVDYLFLGFYGSTQFGLGDTCLLSARSKVLMMIHVILSMAVLMFIATIGISLIH